MDKYQSPKWNSKSLKASVSRLTEWKYNYGMAIKRKIERYCKPAVSLLKQSERAGSTPLKSAFIFFTEFY